MPGADPQTETMAITQGHLPHNAESPPAAPNAEYVSHIGAEIVAGEARRTSSSDGRLGTDAVAV